jgi:hypothetical protein
MFFKPHFNIILRFPHRIFLHDLIKGTIFKQKNIIEYKMYFDFLYKFCLKHFSFWEEFSEILSQMDIGLHVKYSLMSDFNETCIFSIDFRGMLKY